LAYIYSAIDLGVYVTNFHFDLRPVVKPNEHLDKMIRHARFCIEDSTPFLRLLGAPSQKPPGFQSGPGDSVDAD